MTAKARSRRLSRRRFLKLAGGTVAGGVGAAALHALAIEPRWIEVTRPVISIPCLPQPWDGVRIAHITDLHHGRLVPLALIRRAVRLASACRPDLVVLTGDFVSRRDAITDELTEALKALEAPLGAFAVLGNHDHYADAGAIRSALAAAGIETVDNRHVVLTRGGWPLVIAGVGDLWTDTHDLPAALRGAPEDAVRLLLCHNPDYADRMPPRPRVDLMLCGHTHGGQIKIPLGRRPRLPIINRLYAAGWARGPHCQMYVSRGIGMVGVPIRFNCRPELAVLTLRPA